VASPILAQAIEHWNELLAEDSEARDRQDALTKWLTDREAYPTLDAPGSSATYYEDTDPFIFRGRLGGLLTRLSASEITNVHASGSLVASFAIEPRT
jgi:hypothetical protein